MARLVICDDEAHITDILSRFFREKGHEVFGTGRGEDALEQVSARGADLVITDIAMKGLTGLELLKRIRASGADVPVIITTGNPSHHGAAQALREGAADYLVKPFHLEEIAERAARALAGKRVRDENARLGRLAALLDFPAAALRGASADALCDEALRLGAELTRSAAAWRYGAGGEAGVLRPEPDSAELRDFLHGIAKDTVSQKLPKTPAEKPDGGGARYLSVPVDAGKAGALIFSRGNPPGGYADAEIEAAGKLADLFALGLRLAEADTAPAPAKPQKKPKGKAREP